MLTDSYLIMSEFRDGAGARRELFTWLGHGVVMSILAAFHGGPADGTVCKYDYLQRALPRLYWSRGTGSGGAVYQLIDQQQPESPSGVWHYRLATERPD